MAAIATLVARKIAYFVGRNRRGEPCVLLTPARHHSDDASVENVVRLAVSLLELACRECVFVCLFVSPMSLFVFSLGGRMKQPVDRFCILCDYAGFGISSTHALNYLELRLVPPLSDMNYPAVRESILVAGSFFPERIGAAYIVNGTLLARTVVHILLPLIVSL